MGGSLLGATPSQVHRWARWYRGVRKLRVSVGRLWETALRQDGTNPVVTKIKLRKAAALLQAGQRPAAAREAC